MVVSCVQLFIVSSCHMTEFDPRSSSNIRCKGGSCWQYDQTKFMGLGHDLFDQSVCFPRCKLHRIREGGDAIVNVFVLHPV